MEEDQIKTDADHITVYIELAAAKTEKRGNKKDMRKSKRKNDKERSEGKI